MSRSNYLLGAFWHSLPIDVWSKIKFVHEAKRYTVMASNVAFAVCTRKHFGRTMYTVIDFHENVRWTENLVFGYSVDTKKQCEEMLDRLTRWVSEVSSRNFVQLDVEAIEITTGKIIENA